MDGKYANWAIINLPQAYMYDRLKKHTNTVTYYN